MIPTHPGSARGAAMMHRIIEVATGDIARRLWTLYWLARATHTENGIIAELGVREGDSTRALLAACIDAGIMLISWDIEDCIGRVYDRSESLGFKRQEINGYWRFVCYDSTKVNVESILCKYTNTIIPLDLVFVDTDHTAETTTKELNVWAPHVRVGGCLTFHDYWLADGPGRDGVKVALDHWYGDHEKEWLLETHDAYSDPGFAILWRLK